MFDERAFIARVEAAGPDEFARLLTRPTADPERALRAHLGDERYQRLHGMALRRSVRAAPRGGRSNVVVIHGIMGGELTATRDGAGEQVWAKLFALVRGRASRLRLAPDGITDGEPGLTVQATGIMKRAYGEIILSLGERWNVQAYWYDWRKDLRLAAAELETRVNGWFGPDAPVHIVAHSMGGLVARTFIKTRRKRWDRMAGGAGGSPDARGGRLVMLGTPNHGSFAIPQVITGIDEMVRKLALVDVRHTVGDLIPIFNSFVGSYQMLPSPFAMPDVAWLYDSNSYTSVAVPQAHLDAARAHHEFLLDVVDPTRMIYVAGYDQPTFDGLTRRRPDLLDAYHVTRAGDGRVPHALGLLPDVPAYYVDESHGDLAGNNAVLAAVDELLESGATRALPTAAPAQRAARSQSDGLAEFRRERDAELQRFELLVQRARTRSADPEARQQVTPAEREVEESLTRGFLPTERAARRPPHAAARGERVAIEFRLVRAGIEATEAYDTPDLPVDAIAVGHYLGVRPQAAELALDRVLSEALRQPVGSGGRRAAGATNGRRAARRSELAPAELILTEYSERGIIRGELAQPFFLADPRPLKPARRDGSRGGRVIAIAGMGVPGRFGSPELTVLARELCWSLGRMGKAHLATVVIGSGTGNLSIADALAAWVRGVRNALTSSADAGEPALRRITIVEQDPRRIAAIQRGIEQAAETELRRATRERAWLDIDFAPLDSRRLAALAVEGSERERDEWLRRNARDAAVHDASAAPTRITLSLDHDTYRFGAITEDAAIPERDVALDPALVMQANDELAGEGEPDRQRDRGRFLGKLLVPEDLRAQLASDVPIVMMLDSTTARIHWEMVAYADVGGGAGNELDDFLGTSRGLTRQLRTTFAPPPEPTPPPRRVLRVLVVADPAADAHLPGAEAEGAEVAALFESFNTVYGSATENRIEVVRLSGPGEAKRTRVMSELMLKTYDILHFAGHCVYDVASPANSGWIFTNGERLRANELQRIDRIPKFVFSNACESGITPDRSERRTAALAPSFAEAFFARGVANFVCTAWPVDDVAARVFATALYGGLVGLKPAAERPGRYEPGPVLRMHEAMRAARRTIGSEEYGARTWGAYQHYGNPYLQLFDPAALGAHGNALPDAADRDGARPRRPSAAKRKGAARRRAR